MHPLLTPEEVALRLNTTKRNVLDWLRAGTLIGVKVGKEWRIEPAELDDFIRRNRRSKKDEDRNAE